MIWIIYYSEKIVTKTYIYTAVVSCMYFNYCLRSKCISHNFGIIKTLYILSIY